MVVMSIPIRLLWNVQMPRRQKLGLVGIFCLTIIVIIFSLTRATILAAWDGKDIILANIEMTMGKS